MSKSFDAIFDLDGLDGAWLNFALGAIATEEISGAVANRHFTGNDIKLQENIACQDEGTSSIPALDPKTGIQLSAEQVGSFTQAALERPPSSSLGQTSYSHSRPKPDSHRESRTPIKLSKTPISTDHYYKRTPAASSFKVRKLSRTKRFIGKPGDARHALEGVLKKRTTMTFPKVNRVHMIKCDCCEKWMQCTINPTQRPSIYICVICAGRKGNNYSFEVLEAR